MPAMWVAPELGKFKYDGLFWTASVDAPAFKIFTYEGKPRGKVELAFYGEDESDVPTGAMAKLASAVLGNQSKLAPLVVSTLWEDINGRGPNSGMWWHGGLEEFAEALEFSGMPMPKKADDLKKLLRLGQIVINKRTWGYEKPIATLSFSAAFEEEHGVGVLTDGKSILGTGYSADAGLFKESKPRPKSKSKRR